MILIIVSIIVCLGFGYFYKDYNVDLFKSRHRDELKREEKNISKWLLSINKDIDFEEFIEEKEDIENCRNDEEQNKYLFSKEIKDKRIFNRMDSKMTPWSELSYYFKNIYSRKEKKEIKKSKHKNYKNY